MCSFAPLLPPPLRVAEPIPLPKSGKGSHPPIQLSSIFCTGALNYVEFRAAMHLSWCMAERVGFEPTSPFGRTAFRERRLQPLGNLSNSPKQIKTTYTSIKPL